MQSLVKCLDGLAEDVKSSLSLCLDDREQSQMQSALSEAVLGCAMRELASGRLCVQCP